MGTVGEKEAKSRLIEHNLRLVVYIAKKFENTGVGIEDLISNQSGAKSIAPFIQE